MGDASAEAADASVSEENEPGSSSKKGGKKGSSKKGTTKGIRRAGKNKKPDKPPIDRGCEPREATTAWPMRATNMPAAAPESARLRAQDNGHMNATDPAARTDAEWKKP